MNWFWNDWILIGIAVAIAAVGMMLGYVGIIGLELTIVALLPLFVALAVGSFSALVHAFRAFTGFADRSTSRWPNWLRVFLGIPQSSIFMGNRPSGKDDAQN